jgi:hypothetical protein
MSNLTDAIVANGNNALPSNEALSAMVIADKGNSGIAGAGVSLLGTATIDCKAEYGWYPRLVYINSAGNFSFKTLDGNPHVLPVADKTWINTAFIKEIYEASHATMATTATGVHVYA